MFSKEDERQLAERGISSDLALKQLERFKIGFEPIQLAKTATVGDGILKLSEEVQQEAVKTFQNFEGSVAKFVPASGAATRMFKALFEFRETVGATERSKELSYFIDNLKAFAFYEDLERAFEKLHGKQITSAVAEKEYEVVIDCLLGAGGLGYGSLPKGLLAFHRYGQNSRTPAIEQLKEGFMHLPENSDFHAHFTVSPEFEEMFEKHVEDNVQGEHKLKKLSFSSQESATDKVAVDLNNEIFREDDGKMLFRPAGHGALLRNLNRIDEDIVFIKNIDNVFPDHLKEEVARFKMVIAGILLDYQRRVFDLLERYDGNEDIEIEAKALLVELGTDGALSLEEVIDKLNRPIRVCGMVKNVGEPGGGPFWVTQMDGKVTTQIVEKAQVDLSDPKQRMILEGSTHFNPVDIVCGLKNRKGEKFDLMNFRDDETGFITQKSFGGKKLKAMELPGLWNGGMAEWNTVFVEVPLTTFSPVKTVNDLLKKEHQTNF